MSLIMFLNMVFLNDLFSRIPYQYQGKKFLRAGKRIKKQNIYKIAHVFKLKNQFNIVEIL